MADFYIDESIHDRGDFIVIGLLLCDDNIQSDVETALRDYGFVPGRDEFKSSMRMAGNEAAQMLRSRFRFLLMTKCSLAVAVLPISERGKIVEAACGLVRSITERDSNNASGVVYFDEGMKLALADLPDGWRAEFNCDSRSVGGIQLADSAAHTVSTMLLTEMGIAVKMVPTGEDYLTETGEVELAWELWTSLRYALSSGVPEAGFDEDGWCDPTMKPFGLAISDGCSHAVKVAAITRLGSVWVGCIH